jgi:hypothetical protein
VTTITPRGISRRDAAKLFGLSLSGFDKAVREGKIPFATLPGNKYDMRLLNEAMDRMSGISPATVPLTELQQWQAKKNARGF